MRLRSVQSTINNQVLYTLVDLNQKFAAAEKAQYGHNVSVASLIINLIGNTSIFVITKQNLQKVIGP